MSRMITVAACGFALGFATPRPAACQQSTSSPEPGASTENTRVTTPAPAQAPKPASPAGVASAQPAAPGAAPAQATPPPESAPSAPPPAQATEPETSVAPPTNPAAPAASRSHRVRFVAGEAGLTVLKRPLPSSWVREGQPPSDDSFLAVCVAPCEVDLESNAYQFAVHREDGAILAEPRAYRVHAASTFEAEVHSRASTRRTGWYIWGLMGGAGLVSTTTALLTSCGEDRQCNKYTSLAFWGGLGAMSLSTLIGVPMILQEDELSFTVTPGTALPPRPDDVSSRGLQRQLDALSGVTVSGEL